MFQFIKLCLLAFAILCFSAGCEKQGAMGPQGVEGEAGRKGTIGDRGAAGEKGAKGDRGNTGSTGAKGPKGDRGDTGQQGPAGPRGAQGNRGIGNVIYSEWIQPTGEDLTSNGEIELTTPKLTSAILNTGEVYIYLRDAYDQSAEVFPLEGYNHSYYNFRFSVEVGRILIYTVEELAKGGDMQLNHLPTPRFASYGLQERDPVLEYVYRYVFIPGGTKTSMSINPTDYPSVSKKLRLVEPNFDKSI